MFCVSSIITPVITYSLWCASITWPESNCWGYQKVCSGMFWMFWKMILWKKYWRVRERISVILIYKSNYVKSVQYCWKEHPWAEGLASYKRTREEKSPSLGPKSMRYLRISIVEESRVAVQKASRWCWLSWNYTTQHSDRISSRLSHSEPTFDSLADDWWGHRVCRTSLLVFCGEGLRPVPLWDFVAGTFEGWGALLRLQAVVTGDLRRGGRFSKVWSCNPDRLRGLKNGRILEKSLWTVFKKQSVWWSIGDTVCCHCKICFPMRSIQSDWTWTVYLFCEMYRHHDDIRVQWFTDIHR